MRSRLLRRRRLLRAASRRSGRLGRRAPDAPTPARRPLAAPIPLTLGREICRTARAEGGPSRRGLFLAAARAYAQAAGGAGGAPPLMEGVGSGALEATVNEAARPYFRQGIGLIDGFNHAEGIRAFRAAQALDPDCALCSGAGPTRSARTSTTRWTRQQRARHRAARLARDKAAGATEVERALIEALQTRYSEDPAADRAALDAAYSQAMQVVADRFPENDQVQALAVKAIMDAQPWDYWEPGGRTPKGDAGQAVERLEAVLARNPDHVLGIHLYIHMTEASDDPWRAVDGAERLAGLTPGRGTSCTCRRTPISAWQVRRFAGGQHRRGGG